MTVDTIPAHPSVMEAQLGAGATVTADSLLPEPLLRTSRLILRNMHPQDAPEMHELCAPFEITKYMSLAFHHPYTLDHAKTWIDMQVKDPDKNYVICLKESPEKIIGGIGIMPGSDVQSHIAGITYWIGIPYWSKGYISEALRAFTNYLFAERHATYRKLRAGVCSGNDASMRILTKCGYDREGVLKNHVEKDGEVRDLHLFGLTRADWEDKLKGEEVRVWDEKASVWIWN